MKKVIRVILIVIIVIMALILLDTLQARIFKNSPIISWKEEVEDNDSWVDRGILLDTYYCTKEKDIVTVTWKFKTTKYDCPVDNIENETLERIVMVDGKLYYDTKEEATNITCGTMDGQITSNTRIEYIPSINNQSNFKGEYGYQRSTKNKIVVLIDNKYIIFETR